MGPRLIIAMLVISVVAMFIENTEACLTPSSTKNEILRKKRDTRDVQDGSNRVSTDGDSSRMAPDGLKQRDMTNVPPEDRDAAKDGSARGSTDARDSVILPGAQDGSNRGDTDDTGMKDGSNRGNVDGENLHVVPANGLKQRDMTDVPPEDRDTRPASRDAARGVRGMRPVVMDGENRDIVDSMRNEARDADRLIRNGARMPM